MTSNVTLRERQNDLRNTVHDFMKQDAGVDQLTEDRDLVLAALDFDPAGYMRSGVFTPFASTELELWALVQLPDDDMQRAVVKPLDPSGMTSNSWKKTKDEFTGLDIEIRRAACGLGCRCAAEVRIVY